MAHGKLKNTEVCRTIKVLSPSFLQLQHLCSYTLIYIYIKQNKKFKIRAWRLWWLILIIASIEIPVVINVHDIRFVICDGSKTKHIRLQEHSSETRNAKITHYLLVSVQREFSTSPYSSITCVLCIFNNFIYGVSSPINRHTKILTIQTLRNSVSQPRVRSLTRLHPAEIILLYTSHSILFIVNTAQKKIACFIKFWHWHNKRIYSYVCFLFVNVPTFFL